MILKNVPQNFYHFTRTEGNSRNREWQFIIDKDGIYCEYCKTKLQVYKTILKLFQTVSLAEVEVAYISNTQNLIFSIGTRVLRADIRLNLVHERG